MATIDEQRKRFEKWFTDTVLRRAPQPGQRFERDDVGGYIDPTVHDMWRGYVAGEQARDAEVQALREALTYALHVLECLKADNPNPLLPNARWRSVDMARAALRTEEGTDDE